MATAVEHPSSRWRSAWQWCAPSRWRAWWDKLQQLPAEVRVLQRELDNAQHGLDNAQRQLTLVQAELQTARHALAEAMQQSAATQQQQLEGVQQNLAGSQYQLALVDQRLGALEQYEPIARIAGLLNAMNALENRVAAGEAHGAAQLAHDTHELRFQLQLESLRLRGNLLREPHGVPAVPAPLDTAPTWEASLAQLRPHAPQAFDVWHKLLTVNAQAYEGFPVDSCAVAGHVCGELFRCFLATHLHGNALDLGCGPQGVPLYLQDYPVEHIAGVDPLAPVEPHPFVFHQGVAELLPWRDGTFQTVIAATSLDHVLLLDRALDEIARVLAPRGRFVTWVSFIPGSARYNPYRTDIKPIDPYHLFHFDQTWFEAVLGERFRLVERCVLDRYQSAFYSFAVK